MDIHRTDIMLHGRSSEFRVDLYADTHIGSRSCNEKLLRKHVAETLETGNSWVFIDDAIEGITPDDKRRFNADNVAEWVLSNPRNIIQSECDRWAEIFAPIAKQCMFAIVGDTSHYQTGFISDCMERTLSAMNIRRYKGAVYNTIAFKRNDKSVVRHDIVYAHGFFAGRTGGSKVNNLERCLDYFPRASGFFCGHGHTKAVAPPRVGLYAQGKEVRSIYRRAAMTGGYLNTYETGTTGYGEYKLYPPVALGRITVVLRPWATDDQKIIEVENA